jgi:hypothetical protein
MPPTLILTSPPGVIADPSVVPDVRPPDNAIRFHSPMGDEAFRAAKAEAAKHFVGGDAVAFGNWSLAPLATVAPTLFDEFAGVDQVMAGGRIPPDPFISVGADFMAEVTNRHFDIFRKDNHAHVESKTLAQLFLGYTGNDLFDPRVLRDPATGRWFISADAHQEPGTTTQLFWLAVSTTTDIRSPRCYYAFNMNLTGDDFFDYPTLGVDQNALIVTANVLTADENFVKYGEVVALPKAALLACGGITYTIFSGFPTNLSPPIVYDQNQKSFILSPPETGASVAEFSGQNLGTPGTSTLTYEGEIPVEPYAMAANAPQCTTEQEILTFDARFVAPSTQRGNRIWNVHTTARDTTVSNATPRWYEFDPTTRKVVQTGKITTATAASDWNAALATTGSSEVLVTWTANNQTGCVHPQVMYTGRKSTDPPGTMGPPAAISHASSGIAYHDSSVFPGDPEPWGDYSAVALDPSVIVPGTCDAYRRAWLVNERVAGISRWGTHFGRIGFC